MLSVLALSFNFVNWKLQALNLTVLDQDEHPQSNDFLFTDGNLNQIALKNRYEAYQNLANATNNFKDIGYLDIKNVKFFYDRTNHTIIAEIVTNEEGNYKFAEGATYGMAININPFQNSSYPKIADADYIYKFKFTNGSWNKVLAIRHSDREEEPFTPDKLETKNPLNAEKHNIIMNFNTAKIGKPEEFQVQFFTSTNVSISNRQNYTLVDVVPWVEIPPSTVHLSLVPEVNQVYPWDTKKIAVVITSTSKAATDLVYLGDNRSGHYSSSCSLKELSLLPRLLNNKEFCDYSESCNTYCWNFQVNPVRLDPAKNSFSMDSILFTKDISSVIQPVTLNAIDHRPTLGNYFEEKNDTSQTWQFRVGSKNSDFIESALNFPNKYPYIIGLVTSIGTFFFGLFLDKGSVSSKIRNFLNLQRGNNDNQAANGAAGVN